MFRTFVVLALLLLVAMPVLAEEAHKEGDIAHKAMRQVGSSAPNQLGPLGRGVHGLWNMAIAPFDIPATLMVETTSRENFIEGFLWGLSGGLGNAVVREAAGITELTTIVVLKKSEPLYSRKLGEPAMVLDPLD